MSKKFKIGTRGSLLAVTQCTLIAEKMSELTGAEFELIKISTQGDQQTEKPLWQMDGKDFFTKELDTALLNNEVDLVVHSYKDLGSDRPKGIALATITEREFANDILLIKKETIAKIGDKDKIIVGTSSPRRIVNIESSLSSYLPHLSSNASIKCEMLRGNVNTRIQKLKDGNYDAIVLALAGLERLANKEESHKELETLLSGLTFIVLPQKDFPSSASQGALAIEYNENNKDLELLKVLRSVHCKRTEEEVKRERELFQNFGGGCHLAVGINVQSHKDLFLKVQKGFHQEQKIDLIELEGASYEQIKSLKGFIYNGENEKLIQKEKVTVDLPDRGNYFVTSQYCIEAVQNLKDSTLWASGTSTLKKLVQKGHWVSGTSDSLGHNEIKKLNASKAIQIMTQEKDISVLSHVDAKSEIGRNIGCYKRISNEKPVEDYFDADIYYWNSFHQYELYTKVYPELKSKTHACGLGKTFDQFIDRDIPVTPFIDMHAFKKFYKLQ